MWCPACKTMLFLRTSWMSSTSPGLITFITVPSLRNLISNTSLQPQIKERQGHVSKRQDDQKLNPHSR